MRRFALLAPLALAACQGAPEANAVNDLEAANQAEAPVKEIETLPPNETATAPDEAETAGETQTAGVPAAFQGRWGLVPADCTTKRGDEKGLMTVTADSFKFYESRATLAKVTSATPTRLVADLAFTGEGQSWTRPTVLELKDGALLRSDDEITTPLRYSRCS